MSKQSDYVLIHLESQVLEILGIKKYESTDQLIEYAGQFLCGTNGKLAKEPFNEEFICNVAFNSTQCMPVILWLQLVKLSARYIV
jgi:hypothetical protein